VTDGARLSDIAQKLFSWRYLSHYPDAERDMAWLLEKVRERDVILEGLEAKFEQREWVLPLPQEPTGSGLRRLVEYSNWFIDFG
jgi:hypothetical protein